MSWYKAKSKQHKKYHTEVGIILIKFEEVWFDDWFVIFASRMIVAKTH